MDERSRRDVTSFREGRIDLLRLGVDPREEKLVSRDVGSWERMREEMEEGGFYITRFYDPLDKETLVRDSVELVTSDKVTSDKDVESFLVY